VPCLIGIPVAEARPDQGWTPDAIAHVVPMQRSSCPIHKDIQSVVVGGFVLTAQGLLDMRQHLDFPAAACRLEHRHPSLHVSLANEQQPTRKIDMLPLQGVLFRRTQTRAKRHGVEAHPLRLWQDGQERKEVCNFYFPKIPHGLCFCRSATLYLAPWRARA